MKRWGFGRRMDQDDDMVDKLSPLLADIDPDTWVAPSEEWFGPWGILAQIAIFDQIPRSAFRGTSDAFKWDDLAIKATKVAVERGYFETRTNLLSTSSLFFYHWSTLNLGRIKVGRVVLVRTFE